jgi:large subunit ribosomal protein L29
MKTLVLKDIETNELKERLEAEETRLQQLKLNHAVAPLENPSQIKLLRRDIARMKTELRQRELKK